MRTHTLRSTTALIAVTLMAVACGADESSPAKEATATSTTTPDVLAPFADRLRTAVADDVSNDPTLIGQIALLRVGADQIDASAGLADPGTNEAIDSTMSFRIASVTKTFVAAATLRLVEDGAFSLDDPISTLLPPALTATLRDGGYQPERITVRQLLTHTSGVLDFTFAPGLDFVGQVIADPQRSWSRSDQVQLAMTGDPVGAPGETYHYSDTGYALVGAIIETATGTDLGTALRTLLDYERLGLDHTYLESIEPTPAGQPTRVHQFFGQLDTFGWSPTIDLYGGGGLVSTLDDLVTFFAALLDGDVFDRPDTLTTMLDIPDTNTDVRIPGDPRPYAAAAGLFRHQILESTCWGHDGFWGVSVTVCPDLDAVYATSVSQATRSATYDPGAVLAVMHEAIARSAQ